MKWPNTPLTEALPIRYPIIQAPMAGGATTPQLVAAVSNAGGLGSLGAGYLEPDALRATIADIRELTDKPFAVNLFVPELAPEDPEQIAQANALLAPYRQQLGLSATAPSERSLPNFTEQLAIVLEEAVAVLSFTFGVPKAEELEALKQRGILTLGTATHLLEAIVLEESGVDMVIAQGIEAGGPRGTFIGNQEHGSIGTLALLPVMAKHLRIPFVAAGGIMAGNGIAAALALGASAAVMGTAFLACPESGIHPKYKELLRQGTEMATALTRVFSGKTGRSLKNRFIDELQAHEAELPPYPIQNALTWDIHQAAVQQNRPEFMRLWAGQGCALCSDKPAAELIAQWVEQIGAFIKA